MLNVEKYKHILLEEFYLDADFNIRRAKDSNRSGIKFKKGDLAQFCKNHGYWVMNIPFTNAQIKKSHLVLLLHTGVVLKPKQQIDHIDGNRENDYPDNLRIVTNRINSKNKKMLSNNTSGITGINWHKSSQGYRIQKVIGSKRIYRSAKTLEQASIILEELCSIADEYTQRHGK